MLQYRVDQNMGMVPKAPAMLVQAVDPIQSHGPIELVICHVLVSHDGIPRRGFSAALRCDCRFSRGLLPTLGNDEESYQRAIVLGRLMFERKVRELNPLASSCLDSATQHLPIRQVVLFDRSMYLTYSNK